MILRTRKIAWHYMQPLLENSHNPPGRLSTNHLRWILRQNSWSTLLRPSGLMFPKDGRMVLVLPAWRGFQQKVRRHRVHWPTLASGQKIYTASENSRISLELSLRSWFKTTKRVRINFHCITIILQVIHQTRETVFNHISNTEKRAGYYPPLFRKGACAPSPNEWGTWIVRKRAAEVGPKNRFEPWQLWFLNLMVSLLERRKKQNGSYSATRNCRAR